MTVFALDLLSFFFAFSFLYFFLGLFPYFFYFYGFFLSEKLCSQNFRLTVLHSAALALIYSSHYLYSFSAFLSLLLFLFA